MNMMLGLPVAVCAFADTADAIAAATRDAHNKFCNLITRLHAAGKTMLTRVRAEIEQQLASRRTRGSTVYESIHRLTRNALDLGRRLSQGALDRY
jgi:hypothetical protein